MDLVEGVDYVPTDVVIVNDREIEPDQVGGWTW